MFIFRWLGRLLYGSEALNEADRRAKQPRSPRRSNPRLKKRR